MSESENKNAEPTVSEAVIGRLPRYYRCLQELLAQNILRISSAELSQMMGVTASQIRQDLNCFGGFGQQGYGYNVKYLCSKIGEILGADEAYSAIVIGAGYLGRALAEPGLFLTRGVFLKAVFDTDPACTEEGERNGIPVYPISKLDRYFAENKADIAVLSLPEIKPAFLDRLSALGIRGIWNFSDAEIPAKPGLAVQNVCPGDLLMKLCYGLRVADEQSRRKYEANRERRGNIKDEN